MADAPSRSPDPLSPYRLLQISRELGVRIDDLWPLILPAPKKTTLSASLRERRHGRDAHQEGAQEVHQRPAT